MVKYLLFTTGFQHMDQTLRDIVSRFEVTFPERVSNDILIGSYAEGTGVPLSDIDGMVVFQHSFESASEKEQAK